jgi:hypothetical protein
MPKRGQHHNDAVDTAKPRGHETSRGRNRPDRTEPITTGSYKKPETYAQQAFEHSGNTSDRMPQARPEDFDAFGLDIRESPSNQGSTRARDSDLSGGRSGSDSNQDAGTRGG